MIPSVATQKPTAMHRTAGWWTAAQRPAVFEVLCCGPANIRVEIRPMHGDIEDLMKIRGGCAVYRTAAVHDRFSAALREIRDLTDHPNTGPLMTQYHRDTLETHARRVASARWALRRAMGVRHPGAKC